MQTDLSDQMDAAFMGLLKRYGILPGSEPYELFAAMALEQDRLAEKVAMLEARLDAFTKPKLIVPARAINGAKS